jgi:hypothetical protein
VFSPITRLATALRSRLATPGGAPAFRPPLASIGARLARGRSRPRQLDPRREPDIIR